MGQAVDGLPLCLLCSQRAGFAAHCEAHPSHQPWLWLWLWPPLWCRRYEQKRIDPGSTVGAFGAQSIGAPSASLLKGVVAAGCMIIRTAAHLAASHLIHTPPRHSIPLRCR